MTCFLGLIGLMGTIALSAPSSWSWTWQPSSAEVLAPKVEVCPLLHDKRWAYSVEIDDGPTSTLTVAQPLLARFRSTDAPPGRAGGRDLPFVGGAAVMVQWVGTANPTHLDWDQLRELERRGWGVLNHSYWHTGNHWDPSAALKPADFRRELFWSQALLEANLGPGRGAAHFVFPSGDFNYQKYLNEFDLRSASRVGGTCRTLLGDPLTFQDIDRNWLDESVWSKSNDPMLGFPQPGPKFGELVIDFTHEIETGVDSANQRRWVERLTTIASRYGKAGDDTVWPAPTTDLIAYRLAARLAKVEVVRGRLTVELPDGAPVTPLTLKITGLEARTALDPPPGGSLYRNGDQAWITTPRLGLNRTNPSKPRLKRIYQGPVRDVVFAEAQAIAGVRLLQQGKVARISVELIQENNLILSLIKSEHNKEQWGTWLLFPTVPDRSSVSAREVRVATDPGLREMEVWAVDESVAR